MEKDRQPDGGPDRPARNVGSRKRARGFPKGRQLDAEALREIREIIGPRPRRPDLLIEFLHRYRINAAISPRGTSARSAPKCASRRLRFTRSLRSIPTSM